MALNVLFPKLITEYQVLTDQVYSGYDFFTRVCGNTVAKNTSICTIRQLIQLGPLFKKSPDNLKLPNVVKSVFCAVSFQLGDTLDEVVVGFTPSTREHMHYVALSRVRNIDSLHVLRLNEKS